MANSSHRAGPLKQTNKTHKTGGHRSKGAVDNVNRGRVSSSVSSGGVRKPKVMSKASRRNQMKQARAIKLELISEERRSSSCAAPTLVALVPLAQVDNVLVDKLAELVDGDWTFKSDGHVFSPQQFKRRFHFVQPKHDDLFSILDACKVCDIVVFIVDDSVGRQAERLVKAISDQGLPSQPIFAVNPWFSVEGEKRKVALLRDVKKWTSKICADACDKVFLLGSSQHVTNFFRHLVEVRRAKYSSLRTGRAYLWAESVTFEPHDAHGTLTVSGYVRGEAFNVNRLLHIPGWGDYQIERLRVHPDPRPMKRTDEAAEIILVPNPQLQDDLVAENEPDMLDSEQTWPTDEELAETKQQRVIRVPKGTSKYQAAWILDEGGENEDEDVVEEDGELLPALSSESEDGESAMDDDCESEAMGDDVDVYDAKHVNFEEEQETYSKLKAAKQDEAFPDEVDTPIDVAARVRFQKFRGLKSFRSSPWDARENLPYDYARIFQFENLRRTRRNVVAASNAEGDEYRAMVGTYVSLEVKEVPLHLYSSWSASPGPLVVFSLLKHENKMSVMNVAVRRTCDATNQDAIASKQRLIFHVGCRRFAAGAIFSGHTNGDKHKYERYWRPNQSVVMTMFAPVTYPPANVLVYREMASGRHALVGSGNLLSIDPSRLVIKRVVLSGHPFKVHKRSAVVRFMFFNRADIEWFKPVELRTKYGRRGHIKEPLGTHGHMKVTLDGSVSQQDTVLMNLYKRVFPKWSYDPCVNRPLEPGVAKLQLRKADTNQMEI